ncbi:unnamed protein product [Miscanthus lutarioriparius]|uniref:DUF4220 domain-containing protein n=1 Tax=Miscanthus lutarioriparius TaxID=422564 RepID=A0A811Q7H8_9POAL|nr:unnamed protein product [Miscanthus lutarioriparius]
MALSLALGGLYLVQRVLVGKRRRSGHWLVQYGAMAAYYLPAPLAFYAAKAVYSTSHIDESTPFLVAGVLLILSVTVREDVLLLVTNMRAYSLHYHPRDGYNYLMWLVFLGWVYLEWARIPVCNRNWCWWRWLVGLLKMGLPFLVFLSMFVDTSDSTLDCQTKAVADYMKRESSKSSTSSPFFDDDDDANRNSSLLLLDCCRYPFVQGGNGEWVTVKDLVQRDDLPNEDKDIWLSYSLSRLLARRYYGFHCTEEGDDKVRRLALADLRTTDGYKRAFTIVEVQLAFLHDYFFTASLPIIESGLKYIDAAQKLMELDNMRELVADTLRDIDGPPTNGTRSLKINMDQINWDEISRGSAGYDWLLTCKQETHTDTILIWHIATCYCDMSLRHCDQQEGFPRLADTDTFHEVATTLSRYCAL